MLYKKYGSMDLALAAYNAGPGNVAKYNGIPPFGATKCFIKNVKKEYQDFKAADVVPVVQETKVEENIEETIVSETL